MKIKAKNKKSDRSGRVVHVSPRKQVFKELSTSSFKFAGSHCPSNLEEQKELFLRFGITPQFEFLKGNVTEVFSQPTCQQKNDVRFEYFYEAKAILDKVKEEFGDGSHYLEEALGGIISCEEANVFVDDYIGRHGLSQEMTVYWSTNLSSSAKMLWTGPHVSCNRPEDRQWSLIIKKGPDNMYVTEYGIRCLVDHEIGSHYFRMYNDGFQPWFPARKKFRIRALNCRASIATEEGLAAINTVLQARRKYLYGPALLYYVACKAQELTFKQLFDHLEHYMSCKDHRWRYVMRVKRCLPDVNTKGGSAQDQTYFEGAVEILRNIDSIDFKVLFSGRICLDEVPRIRRMARTDALRYPLFLQDLPAYIHMLKMIAFINGLGVKPPPLCRLRKTLMKKVNPSTPGPSTVPASVSSSSSSQKSGVSASVSSSSSSQKSDTDISPFQTMITKFKDSPVPMRIPIALENIPSTSTSNQLQSLPSSSNQVPFPKKPKLLFCCGGGPLFVSPPLPKTPQRILDRPATHTVNFSGLNNEIRKKKPPKTAMM